MRVNLLSQIGLIQEVRDDLITGTGRIVIIGSTAALEPYAYGPVYGITKWALRGLAENLRAELRPHKVGVTLLHPGGTWTDLWEGVDLPRERLLEPSDIARLVATMLELSPQAVVDELIIRPIEGDMHD
jgi:NADP-dependent 3-hydroxy acid dehydrogenase YdfG